MPGLVWDINLFKRGSPMSIVSTGIDLAKNVFSVHGVDADGVVLIRRSVSRAKLSQLNVQLPPCLIGMEACSGAHEWARRFSTLGHSVKLMAPKFVAPYRKGGKNDAMMPRRSVRRSPDQLYVSFPSNRLNSSRV